MCLTELLCHPCFTSHCVDTFCTWTQSSARKLGMGASDTHGMGLTTGCGEKPSVGAWITASTDSWSAMRRVLGALVWWEVHTLKTQDHTAAGIAKAGTSTAVVWAGETMFKGLLEQMLMAP